MKMKIAPDVCGYYNFQTVPNKPPKTATHIAHTAHAGELLFSKVKGKLTRSFGSNGLQSAIGMWLKVFFTVSDQEMFIE